jgi:hypothetical protein
MKQRLLKEDENEITFDEDLLPFEKLSLQIRKENERPLVKNYNPQGIDKFLRVQSGRTRA